MSGSAVPPPAAVSVSRVSPLDTRARVAAAAFELFAARGYDGTTVDAIAERAGIARRTFFRHFRSKDDVILPDHDLMLITVNRHLDALDEASPVQAVCSAVRLVLRGYVHERQVAVQRYRLTRSVDALRDREIAAVHRYERSFGRYLRARYLARYPETQAVLRADVVAAAVVAAHNAVLRDWLRAGGATDPFPALEEAIGWLASTYDQPMLPAEDDGRDVVVAVFRADQPIDDVVQRISRSL